MKQYHTSITINAHLEEVWTALTDFKNYPEWNPIVGKLESEMKEGSKIATFIVPLRNTYFPVLLSYKENQELVWQGTKGSKFLVAAKHYYRLNAISENQTELLHGEYFSGILSNFLTKTFLSTMQAAFEQHNVLLKKRIEKNK
ncbi:MAG: SRPBCC domain-containing protein [Flavobacterium sp.]|nr:SRPBCC domain-containing protein [Flavobacterium sp.]